MFGAQSRKSVDLLLKIVSAIEQGSIGINMVPLVTIIILISILE